MERAVTGRSHDEGQRVKDFPDLEKSHKGLLEGKKVSHNKKQLISDVFTLGYVQVWDSKFQEIEIKLASKEWITKY